MSEITSRIDSLLANRNLRRVDLYKALQIPESSYRSWVKGSTPQVQTLKKVADYFGVSVEYLSMGQIQNENEIKQVDNFNLNEEEKDLIQTFRKLSDKEKSAVVILVNFFSLDGVAK